MRFKEIKIVEAPDLMTQYNRGGKKALPAIKDLQTKLKAAGFDPNGNQQILLNLIVLTLIHQ